MPPDLAVGINTLASRMGISQSALVVVLLGETVPALIKKIDSIPDHSDSKTSSRMRGRSIESIHALVKESLSVI